MPAASVEVLRYILGALGLFFAHFLGRSIGRFTKGWEHRRPLITWTLRYTLSVVTVCYFGIDRFALIILPLHLILFALGWWDEWRPKHRDDLTRQMFPDDE